MFLGLAAPAPLGVLASKHYRAGCNPPYKTLPSSLQSSRLQIDLSIKISNTMFEISECIYFLKLKGKNKLKFCFSN